MREQRSIGHHRFRTGQGQDIQRVRRGKALKEHRGAQGQKAQVSYFNFFPIFFSLFHDYD